jgi:putative acetyltransferase
VRHDLLGSSLLDEPIIGRCRLDRDSGDVVTRPELVIALDDPDAEDVRELLGRHLAFARDVTPPGHVHALEVAALQDPSVTFYSARDHGVVVCVAALKRLDASDVELKSMHTSQAARGRGAGAAMVSHLLAAAAEQGYERVSLETGTMDAFAPARRLYQRAGFRPCEPFGEYTVNPYSVCMRVELSGRPPERP